VSVYAIVFLSFAVLPVDPARSMLGPLASEEAVRQLSGELGLDRPVWERFFSALGRALHGDLGRSIYYARPVTAVLADTLGVTMFRFGLALLIGSLAGGGAGFASAVLNRPKARYVFAATNGLPAFVLMILLLWALVTLGRLSPRNAPVVYELAAVVCPALYAFGAVGLLVSSRLALGEGRNRQSDFLLLLRAPRIDASLILLRASLPAVLSVVANSATTVMTAVTFAEFTFALPGFAVIFIRSCERGDLALVAAGSLVLALTLLILQRVADWGSRRIDSRLSS
jgi:peptide/nickel transport system permease protein